MSTITPCLAIAIRLASVTAVGGHAPVAAATTTPGPSAAPIILVVLAVTFAVLVSRINAQLVSLVAQLLQTVAAVGRMLFVVLVLAVLAVVVVLHL